ncbi:MAG: hypothetical protein JW894_16000 [Bacteroidales bacterium]|nr:hypothetical protein [Bacteroidales bacterium]
MSLNRLINCFRYIFQYTVAISFSILFIQCINHSEAYSQKSPVNIIDHNCTDIHKIPKHWIDSAKAKLNIRYARASHGSQLTSGGMRVLTNFSDEYSNLYSFSPNGKDGSLKLVEFREDLQHQNADWVRITEQYLNTNPKCNVVMWAWCKIYGMDVDKYIADMEYLISKYGNANENRSAVTFIFMTAHTWPWGEKGKWVYEANRKIRKHCEYNDRWLYDFYDIECYNPDGNYFGDGSNNGEYTGKNRLRWDSSYDKGDTRGNWGIEWMKKNPDSELTLLAGDNICVSCAHSEGEGKDDNSRLQCVLKGNAAWWLWARLAGWMPD